MKPVVLFDRTDHWEVIVDYSGSPRHAALSEMEWTNEYSNHPSYAAMRASQPGSFAMMAPQGAGKWKKDWSGPWTPA